MAAEDELDWDNLRYFQRAAQTGTLAGAARTMGVDHSTNGRRLAALERTFDAPLVIRARELRAAPVRVPVVTTIYLLGLRAAISAAAC